VNVYVESNFVLQLALLQEFHANCDAIVKLCEAGRAQLVIPAFSLIEPYRTLGRHHAQRVRIKGDLDIELRQLARTSSFTERLADFESLTSLLIDSAEEESTRWESVRERLLRAAEVVPIDAEVLATASRQRHVYALEPHDAIVYASVLSHLERSGGVASCFINADAKDFDDPNLVAELADRHCKLIFRFDDGLRYLSHASAPE
jgi:predicted nucleic acid-binding protein